jgi:hypothetical protein
LTAQGEAIDFEWFSEDEIPDDSDVGFGQGQVIRAALAEVRSHGS